MENFNILMMCMVIVGFVIILVVMNIWYETTQNQINDLRREIFDLQMKLMFGKEK